MIDFGMQEHGGHRDPRRTQRQSVIDLGFQRRKESFLVFVGRKKRFFAVSAVVRCVRCATFWNTADTAVHSKHGERSVALD